MIKFRERIRYGKEVLHVTSPSRASDAELSQLTHGAASWAFSPFPQLILEEGASLSAQGRQAQ